MNKHGVDWNSSLCRILQKRMELDKLGRQLKLMAALTQNHTLRIDEISEVVGMNRRTIYRYLAAFREVGFVVEKEGKVYRLDQSSPFFQKISQGISFTEDEALTLSQIVNSTYSSSPKVKALREKLAGLYHLDTLMKHGLKNNTAKNVSNLFNAISEQRVVLFRNYKEDADAPANNHIVEPYQFIDDNKEICCYEIATKTNRVFKVDNMESVEFIDLLWAHEKEHVPFYKDVFGGMGQQQLPVSLILGDLSTRMLLEKISSVQSQLQPLSDGRYRLDAQVCNYAAVGRFVLALFDDIEVVDSPEFSSFLEQKIAKMCERMLH